jgi:uncharacterized membrane protein
MAGIGFELKKIYKKRNLKNMLRGIGYSTVVTVGPTVMTISAILLSYWLLGISRESFADRELLSSMILYSFIFPFMITTPFNTVWSRYIADKIFTEQFDDILSSYYVGLVCVSAIGALLGVPFLVRSWFVSDISVRFLFTGYCLYMSVIIVFFTMTYLSATKDYKIITLYFVLGLLFGVGIAVFLVKGKGDALIDGILTGMAVGFFLIAVGQFTYVRRYFRVFSRNYKECIRYVWRYKLLFLSSFFYVLGLYVHNFVFWTTRMSVLVKDTFVSAPPYDMASFLAMMTNISTMIIFIVIVETDFHDRYQLYSEAVLRATLKEIRKAREDMFRLLQNQIAYIVEIQSILSCLIFLVVEIFFPVLGFSGEIIQIYPVLAVGYLMIFVMYCNIVYLYYFSDHFGGFVTAFLFCGVTFFVSLWARQLSMQFYGIGAFIGALAGWTYSFFRLRYMEKNLDFHIYGRGKLLPERREDMPTAVSFHKE